MYQVARRSVIALMLLGAPALARPGDAPAPRPCVNPGVRDGARRTLHDATATRGALAPPDGTRLYVITQAASEGEVFVIDVAKNKVVAQAAPTRCAAGTARVR